MRPHGARLAIGPAPAMLRGLTVGAVLLAAGVVCAQPPPLAGGTPAYTATDLGCLVITPWVHEPHVPTWSGACPNGIAEGAATLQGRLAEKSYRYEGTLSRGMRHGAGTFAFPSGDQYAGAWRNNLMHGQGTYRWRDGSEHTGEYRDNKFHGPGVLALANGVRYEGAFREGRMHGMGMQTTPSGNRYEGEFRNDLRHGRGILTFPNGNRYEGDWENGKRHGKALYTWPNGSRYEGEYDNDLPHGIGTLRDGRTLQIYEGEWNKGCFKQGSRRAWLFVEEAACK